MDKTREDNIHDVTQTFNTGENSKKTEIKSLRSDHKKIDSYNFIYCFLHVKKILR